MTHHPELDLEQAYLDRAYAHLSRMRERTKQAASITESAAQAVDSSIARAHLHARLRTLDTDVDGLTFGRLDAEDGDTWYVGRRHVEDERGDPVVVDWRAPVSTPFYRATAADPMELRRRRRFLMTARQVDDLFDEVFDDPDSVDAAHHGGIPDPLLAELERSRTGEMRDIVATIAAEQDVVIRAPIDTCLVVQGGPGTGKTAVGLHRAAFLLFEHREQLDKEGVLVVGPNPLFLRYIAQVLPSLGEAATRQTTVERLVGGRVLRSDAPELARLKGDARLAQVLARAARQFIKVPEDDLAISTAWGRLRIPATALNEAVDEITARDVPFAVGRNAFRTRVRRLAWLGHPDSRWEDAAPTAAFDAEMRTNTALNAAVGKIWPSLSAPVLVKRVLTNKRALAAAADGLLDESEQTVLLRRAGASRIDDEPWTLAELVLVDEAEALLNGVGRTYGHAVVDEAQDLSAMALRAIARRCPSRSMTVLGDLAQATEPGAQTSWEDAVVHLGSPATASIEELELGYRVPRPILDVANRLLPAVAPGVRAARSVRLDGEPPMVIAAAVGELPSRVASVAADLAARWGSVGVVVPANLTDEVADALGTAGVTFGTGARGGLADVVTLLAPPEAKGLEFDAVIVVEPSAVYDDARGGRLLYIALDACGAGARHRPRRTAPGRAAGLTGVAEVGGDTIGAARLPPDGHPTVRPLLLRFASITAVAGVGLAAVGVALVPAIEELSSAGSSDEAMIDLGPLDQRSYVYAADGSLLTTLQAEIDRQPVPLSEIPQHTIDAVLAVEDADFYSHDGVNIRSTLRALVRNVDEGETVQGGSTITQQVVKEELVGNEQSLDRKAREAVLARRLEDLMTKDEILERYLNTVYLGNGAYGVQAGAETYFDRSVAELDIIQSAFLAGIIANPARFDPVRNPEDSKARRDIALRRLAAVDVVSDEAAEYMTSAPMPTTINQFNPETQDYFVEEVKQILFDDPRLGATREERQNRVFRGGLRIYTTLDPRAQALATSSRNDVLAELSPEGTPAGTTPNGLHPGPGPLTGTPISATGVVVSVQPHTGAVRAMVGGAGFGTDPYNIATQGVGRSGGSTFKIFVLLALLENGYLPTDSVNGGGPCTFRDIPGMFPDPYTVENFSNSGGGSGTILSQTLRSSNCAYVRLGQIVGTDKVVQQARRMGITTPLEEAVSMPLGTKEVYPIDMAAAVASIAADGTFNAPYYIDRVEGPDGDVILAHEPDPRRAESVQSARLAAEVLERNVESGTGTRARIPGQHAAGKTGTAQDASDGWFVGFTPYLATAVWIGTPDGKFEVRIGGTGITGGSYPAEMWGRYMRAWHEGLPELAYGEPEPITRSSRYLRAGPRVRLRWRGRLERVVVLGGLHDDDHDPAGGGHDHHDPGRPSDDHVAPDHDRPADDVAVTCQDGRA